MKEEFLAFYLNANWNTSAGMPKADLDSFNVNGRVDIDSETQVQISYLKNMFRKLDILETLAGDERDIL